MKYALDNAQLEQFYREGCVVLRGCFTREAAQPLIDDAFQQLGYDPARPETWEKPLAFLYPSFQAPLRELAPRAWAGICQLVGGEDRIPSASVGVGQWVINFHRGRDEAWTPPSPAVSGWHVDGNFFRHFLDSPEQGLLVTPIFSAIESRGGGTVFAADSIPVIARLLHAHPGGILPNEFDFPSLVGECREFRQLTGELGDVALMHPFLLHSFSQNHSGRPRLITNLCISLKEPMQFNSPAACSPVERAVLLALGVEKLNFQPTAPRERVR